MPYPKIIKEDSKEFVVCPITEKKIPMLSHKFKYNFDLKAEDFIGRCCRGSSDPDSERNCPYHSWRGILEGAEVMRCNIPPGELHNELF